MKLLNDNVIENCFKNTIERYLNNKTATKLKIHMIDTTAINNKLGEQNVGRNMCYKGKKVTKISLIADSKGILLNVNIYSGNRHDASILYEQLDKKNINN